MDRPIEEEIAKYIALHRTEDFPMDLSLEEFYEKVKEFN